MAKAITGIYAAAAFAVAISIGSRLATAGDFGTLPLSRDGVGRTDQWTWKFTSYAWLAYLTGDTTVKGRTAGVDVNPYQVLTNLKAMPWMSYGEGRKGRFAFYNDIVYAKIGVSGGIVKARNFGAIGSGSVTVNGSLDSEQTIVELGGAYELTRWPVGGAAGGEGFVPFTAFDILAGARYWRQDLELSVAAAGAVNIGGLQISGNRAIARGGTVDWVDPLVGFRFRHSFAPGHEMVLRADVGGFDVGSQFSWNVVAAYSFDLMVRHGVRYSGVIGYRALDVDYAKGSNQTRYEYDVLQHGPISALTISF
ncbi:MAG: hypothetical protein AB7O43_07005 [Hyphomicrobiaceae bacterium]